MYVIQPPPLVPPAGFLDSHPGGKEMLLLSAGRECTDLFASYHALTPKPAKYLAPMCIGSLTGPTEFPVYKPDNGFYKTLSTRVAAYFEKTGKNAKNPVPGILRMIPVFALAAAAFAVMNGLLLPGAGMPVKVLAAIVFGICQVMPLLHTMHDASHAAVGPNEAWWKAISRGCLDWYAGASMISWHHQHVVGHHVYTNVFAADPDLPWLETGDIRRIVPRQAWKALYKWQHVYLPIAYGLLTLKFRLQVRARMCAGRMCRVLACGWEAGLRASSP
jgi:hypothetical protein